MPDDIKIDLVYCWVNSNDKTWQERLNTFLQQNENPNKDYTKLLSKDCHYREFGELKYSLRSVEKNIPWINKIFIITDKQVPQWLNTQNPKIRIVDHSEIIPQKNLPLFNSCAIESRIPYIEELSEHFIYANDDILFWNKADKNFFFEGDKAICRFGKKIPQKSYKNGLYGQMIRYSHNKFQEKFGVSIPYFPHHNADSYLKSNMLECINEFKPEFEETLSHHFKSTHDIERIIFSYYAVYKNKAVQKRGNIFSGDFCILNKFSLIRILLSQSTLMCVNDSSHATDWDIEVLKKIFELRFPNKSEFEK